MASEACEARVHTTGRRCKAPAFRIYGKRWLCRQHHRVARELRSEELIRRGRNVEKCDECGLACRYMVHLSRFRGHGRVLYCAHCAEGLYGRYQVQAPKKKKAKTVKPESKQQKLF